MISISVSFLGFLIIKFEFEEIFHDFGLREDFFLYAVSFFGILILFLLKIFFYQPILVWISMCVMYFFVYFFPLILKWKFESELRDYFIIFLDKITLSMQSGIPMRSAMIKASDEFSGWKKKQFKYLISSVEIGQKSDKFNSKILRKLQKEIVKIDNSKTKIYEQIKTFRDCLKMEQNVRHRSRQVTLNLKIQSLVMTIMYFLIALFMYSQFDMKSSKLVLLISLFFFITGLVFTFFIGRRMKWKT